MKILKLLTLCVLFSVFGCSFSSKKKQIEKKNSPELNIYAENNKGGYLLIKTNNKGEAYFKMKGANYSNHYYGQLNENDGMITFTADKAIRLNSCKSGKYGKNIIGLDFGKDEKVLNELKSFDIFYQEDKEKSKKLTISDLKTYIEIPKRDNVTLMLKSNDRTFFKDEKISFNPSTTMLCASSRIRLKEYSFKIEGNTLTAVNYFGMPQIYELKKSPF